MGRIEWMEIAINVDIPAPRVCKNCIHSKTGCRERATCTDYAVERIIRGMALNIKNKKCDAEYIGNELARKAQRKKGKEW